MRSAILILLFTISNSYSYSSYHDVIYRTKKGKSKLGKKELINLSSKKSYEGKHFKIVEGKNETAITFKDDKLLQLKAATTYYHLTKAYNYFANTLNSKVVKAMPQTTIRLNLINKFHHRGHFANDNNEPQFNNALSINAGEAIPSKGITAWNKEIWFRPPKDIHAKDLPMYEEEQVTFKQLVGKFRKRLHMTTFQKFLTSLLIDMPVDSNIRTAGTSIFIELAYRTSRIWSPLFGKSWYKMDAALVPEIIYHEFAHVAMSDYLELSHSSSVNEGIADFFAGKIGETDELARKIGKYNKYDGKKAKNKKQYSTSLEHPDYANSDFVFGLFWAVSKEFGRSKEGERVVFAMRKDLTSYSTIKNDLVDAFIKACSESCEDPFTDQLKIYQIFQNLGI